jgi:hypothetical protein
LLGPELVLHPLVSSRCSCFNAFSRVDVRVDVKIPGGVTAYVIDLRGERCVFLSLSHLDTPSTAPHTQTSSYSGHLARNIPLLPPPRDPVLGRSDLLSRSLSSARTDFHARR